jgi:hypothetical protein
VAWEKKRQQSKKWKMGVGRENIARCHERTKKLPGVPDSYTVRKKWFEKKYKTHTNCTVKSSTHPKIALTVACVGACALEGKFSGENFLFDP